MAQRPLRWLKVSGRNGVDSPGELPEDMAAEALNIRLVKGAIGEKRYGSSVRTFTGATFSGFNAMANFVPGQNDAAAEFHWISRDATAKFMRVAAGTAATELTPKDVIASLPQNATYATINGKLYIAYDSSQNRMHVFDPAISTTEVRRSGLPLPGAPTAADAGGVGTYSAVERLYRVRWLTLSGTRIKIKSDSATTLSFTPSGSNLNVTVTRPAAPGEHETHWQVEASEDDGGTWYVLSDPIAIATTTYSDTTEPSTYGGSADLDEADEIGANKPAPSCKFIVSTGTRLLMYGAYETATGDSLRPVNGRVYYGPVLGTSIDESDDDERVSDSFDIKGYIDVSRDSGAEDRAICGPVDGVVYVFQSRGIQMLVPTGNIERPYRMVTLSDTFGALSHQSTFQGTDQAGRPCVYFLDPEMGPMRYGSAGFEWLGYDVQDIWETINLSAANRVAHGCFYMREKQAMFWIATGASDDPDKVIVFKATLGRPTQGEGVRYGWSIYTGLMATARCSVMFADTFGATMSRKRKPYAGLSSTSLLKTEDSAATDDNGTTFQAYVLSRSYTMNADELYKEILSAYLLARKNAGVTIAMTYTRNYGDETARGGTVSLGAISAGAAETYVMPSFNDFELRDAWTFQIQLGDAAAIANAWRINHFFAMVNITNEPKANLS